MDFFFRLPAMISIWLVFASSGAIAAQEMAGGERPVVPVAIQAPAMAMAPTRAEEILRRFDLNGDGRLDDDEKADAHEVMLEEKMANEVALAGAAALAAIPGLVLELFDSNHDGRIDERERGEAIAFIEETRRTAREETLLGRFDRDRDGKLDEIERREARADAGPPRTEPMQETLLKTYDVNADGRLEPEEKTAIRAAFINRPTRAPASASTPADAAASSERKM